MNIELDFKTLILLTKIIQIIDIEFIQNYLNSVQTLKSLTFQTISVGKKRKANVCYLLINMSITYIN